MAPIFRVLVQIILLSACASAAFTSLSHSTNGAKTKISLGSLCGTLSADDNIYNDDIQESLLSSILKTVAVVDPETSFQCSGHKSDNISRCLLKNQ